MQTVLGTQWFFWLIPVFVAALWVVIGLALGGVSGWSALASSFRLEDEFQGEKWGWQSAGMRWGTRFKHSLTVGCNVRGLYLRGALVMRPFLPALLIPWHEISARPTKYFGFDFLELTLGREQQIPLLLRPHLAARLRLEERGLASRTV